MVTKSWLHRDRPLPPPLWLLRLAGISTLKMGDANTWMEEEVCSADLGADFAAFQHVRPVLYRGNVVRSIRGTR